MFPCIEPIQEHRDIADPPPFLDAAIQTFSFILFTHLFSLFSPCCGHMEGLRGLRDLLYGSSRHRTCSDQV
jgi:hypothetical protein